MIFRKFRSGRSQADPVPRRKKDVYERCVLCGAMTDVPKTLPIDQRAGYVPGGGQLCRRCCRELIREAEADRREQIRR